MLAEIITFIVLAHIGLFSISLYLHRSIAHRSIVLNKYLDKFFRFCLWMLSWYTLKIWISLHRYHHAHPDTDLDPHSPKNVGFWRLLIVGPRKFAEQAIYSDPSIIEKYSPDFTEDRLETFYINHPYLGRIITFLILFYFFGAISAIVIFAMQQLHLAVSERLFAAVSHSGIGYKNFDNGDNSCNYFPIGIIQVGEEMHNNHHKNTKNWSFRYKWYEIDPTAIIIQILIWVKLAHEPKEKYHELV